MTRPPLHGVLACSLHTNLKLGLDLCSCFLCARSSFRFDFGSIHLARSCIYPYHLMSHFLLTFLLAFVSSFNRSCTSIGYTEQFCCTISFRGRYQNVTKSLFRPITFIMIRSRGLCTAVHVDHGRPHLKSNSSQRCASQKGKILDAFIPSDLLLEHTSRCARSSRDGRKRVPKGDILPGSETSPNERDTGEPWHREMGNPQSRCVSQSSADQEQLDNPLSRHMRLGTKGKGLTKRPRS